MPGPSLATGYIQIIPSMDGAGKTIMDEMTPQAQNAGGKVGGILGGVLKKYITAAGLGMALKKSLTEGANLEQSLGGVETLYKKHANIVIKNADNAWKTAGVSANQYMEMSTSFAASLLQSVGGNTKAAAKASDMAIRDMSDNANKFGTDIESIQMAYQGFSKQNYTMLDNLKLGYGGTKTEMERLLVDAEKLTGQKYDINNLNDVYSAIHAVQGELGVTGTTAKEASSTLSGSMDSMKAAFDNFMADLTLGRNIGPAMSALVESASVFLFNNLIPAVLNIAMSLPGALFEGVKKGVPMLLASMADLAPKIYDAAANIFEDIGDFVAGAINDFAKDPSAAKGGLNLILNIVKGILKGIPKVLKAFWDMRSKIFKALLNLASAVIAKGKTVAINFAKGLLQSGKSAVSNAWNSIKSTISAKISNIVSTVRSKISAVKSAITSPFQKAKNTVKGIVDKIKGFFNFKVNKPKVPVPHFSISPAGWKVGDLLKGKIPKLSVKWYAKGGIFDQPTLAGIGEAGPEAVVPLTKLWSKLDAIATSVMAANRSASNGSGGVVEIKIGDEVIFRKFIEFVQGQTLQFGSSPI